MAERLSAEEIERADFSIGLRGYDRDEVEAFLRHVAGQQRRLLEEVEASRRRSDKPYHVFGSDVGELLQHAKDSADALRRKAEEDAADIRQQAKKAAAATREKAEQDARDARKAAEYDAGERIKAAEHRVAQLRAEEARARDKLRGVRAELSSVTARLVDVERSLDGHAPGPADAQPPQQEGAAAEGGPPAEAGEQDGSARPAASSAA
ncbi:MAG TPA: DivIVA domain-containing protein [Actinomycetota bacterium]|nr:DivIVA domain-containing protein [Actinomycetota bacterium]